MIAIRIFDLAAGFAGMLALGAIAFALLATVACVRALLRKRPHVARPKQEGPAQDGQWLKDFG